MVRTLVQEPSVVKAGLIRTLTIPRVWRVSAAGDRAILVRLGVVMEPELLAQVLAFDAALRDRRPAGLLGTVPAYASLLCHYDPVVTDAARLEASIRQFEGRVDGSMPSGSTVEIPTRYDGPDLGDVALKTNLTPADVIDWHAGREYLVYCGGFAPGFTYSGSLPEELSVPRLAPARTPEPAGSVRGGPQPTRRHV